eukprot:GILI01026166.1.p2 GENE.GILI01026166.1~~GILI01026166.1.p2  ORF type:complete len:187 (-),score=35.03 GILI01026166.1:735-1250(-)
MPKTIPLTSLDTEVESVIASGKLPLILDASGNADTFFSYRSAIVVSPKKYVVLKAQGTSVDEIHEQLRKNLVNALKFGQTLVLAFQNSAPNFLTSFCSPDHFPIEVFSDPQSILNEEVLNRITRPEDRTHNMFTPRNGFSVVVTSTFPPEDYEEFLSSSIPLNAAEVLVIV